MYEVFFAQSNSFLAISSQSPPELDPNSRQLTQTTFFVPLEPFGTYHAKHGLSIVEKACLLIRCSAMNVLLLHACASAGMCLQSRCLAMGLYVTILHIYIYIVVDRKGL
jgi:hypothetical protein